MYNRFVRFVKFKRLINKNHKNKHLQQKHQREQYHWKSQEETNYLYYIYYEINQLIKAPKTIVSMVLFTAGILGFWGYNYFMHKTEQSNYVNQLETKLESLDQDIAMNRSMTNTPTGEISYQLLNFDREQLEQQLINAQLIKHDPEREYRWRNELSAVIHREEAVLIALYQWREARILEPEKEGFTNNDIMKVDFSATTLPVRYHQYTEASLISNIQLHNYLLNTDTRPVLQYDMGAWQVLYRLVTVFGMFAIPVFITVMCADLFSLKKRKKNNTPILQSDSWVRIYTGKLIASFVLCVGFIIIIILLIFGITSLIKGTGLANYPLYLIQTAANREIKPFTGNVSAFLNRLDPTDIMPAGFVPTWEYLILIALFIMLYILFLLSLSALISILIKNGTLAVIISLTVVIISILIRLVIPLEGFVWNPLEYSNVNALATGALNGAIWYPAVWLGVLIIIGLLLMRKKINKNY